MARKKCAESFKKTLRTFFFKVLQSGTSLAEHTQRKCKVKSSVHVPSAAFDPELRPKVAHVEAFVVQLIAISFFDLRRQAHLRLKNLET